MSGTDIETMTTDDTKRGDRIRQARQAKQLSQQALSNAIGVNSGQVSRLERGLNAPSGKVLAELCDVLGVSADYILSGRPGAAAPEPPGAPPPSIPRVLGLTKSAACKPGSPPGPGADRATGVRFSDPAVDQLTCCARGRRRSEPPGGDVGRPQQREKLRAAAENQACAEEAVIRCNFPVRRTRVQPQFTSPYGRWCGGGGVEVSEGELRALARAEWERIGGHDAPRSALRVAVELGCGLWAHTRRPAACVYDPEVDGLRLDLTQLHALPDAAVYREACRHVLRREGLPWEGEEATRLGECLASLLAPGFCLEHCVADLGK